MKNFNANQSKQRHRKQHAKIAEAEKLMLSPIKQWHVLPLLCKSSLQGHGFL
jgi:hypothetical protein